MHSIRTRRLRATMSAAALEDEFASLREKFYARLQSERVQLTVFAAELTRADSDSGRLFERLRQFAHNTRGAAAIFQSLQVADAANSLEQAAAAAASSHANGSDPSVWGALVALTDVLADLSPERSSASAGDTRI